MTMYSPRFCYANYATNDSITVATNSATKIRLVDRNKERKYISSSGDETATITITISKTVDTLVFLNTNMLNFTCKYNTTNEFTPVVADEGSTLGVANIVDGSGDQVIDGSGVNLISRGGGWIILQ